ncbi:hypothetical protein D8682_25415 [Buttiauxella sp. 3AFRM03]|uniref:hypothetical protein n=1 Tax=Buttiauxella sp. 3AFRM03 TaxID=2479367 RepID=UPI000EF7BCDB|nr:hypothetical protein [Buttiauxella sp. 3AFRM03]AYN30495.1 hypothetical protein D8682_25415 [Buttiauxella sp. 3AFRM03]
MKNIQYAAVVVTLSMLSFGASAAQSSATTGTQTAPSPVWNVADVEAGSNIQLGELSTGQSMDDAFNVYTLVAGDWS